MAATSWTIAALFIRFFAALVLIYVVLPTFVIVPLSFSSESFPRRAGRCAGTSSSSLSRTTSSP
jgi:ABC-type spermidine/putrescine transport system permease subunit II